MELTLLRAQLPQSTMGQLFMNNKLLCIYLAVNNKKGWTPVAGLPDGRYSLRKPGKGNEDWSLKVISDKSRKALMMNLSKLSHEEFVGYDEEAPLYLSWGNGKEQITELAKRNIKQIVAAIEKGDKVFVTISSKYLG